MNKLNFSIRIQLMLYISTIIIIIVLMYTFMNNIFLLKYYKSEKTKILVETKNEIDKILTKHYIDEYETLICLEKLSAEKNVEIYVYDIAMNGDLLALDIYYPSPEYLTYLKNLELQKKIKDFSSRKNEYINPLKKNNELVMYLVTNSKTKVQYVELFGVLESGKRVYINASFSNVFEAVNVVNNFMLLIGTLILIIFIIITYFFTIVFIRPILAITHIAMRMSEFDFDTKYDMRCNNEFDLLGESMNILSDNLENTLAKLKESNAKLKIELERKTEVEDMRKEFLSNISHEFKTPIALIQGYAEAVYDGFLTTKEDEREYLSIIIDEAKKMDDIVVRLLNLNELEFGENKLKITRVDITEVINELLRNTKILFDKNDAKILFDYDNKTRYVWVDENMIIEVFTNYISNALNHIKEINGEKYLKVTFDEKNDSIRVGIFNTGYNIPNEDIDNIWEKFYKVDKARTREYGGNGVGLSIVKVIMEKHKMGYGVENKDNGVEFFVELDSTKPD